MKKISLSLALIVILSQLFGIIGNAKAQSRWYHYGETIGNLRENPLYLYSGVLFPDSTVLVKFSNGYFPPEIHAIADVLDVTSPLFNGASYNGELYIGKNSGYKLDTIDFHFFYTRNIKDTAIVDTLLFEVAVNNSAVFVPNVSAGSQVAANLGTDSVYFKLISYNPVNNVLDLSNKVIYKIPLRDKDTVIGGEGVNNVEVATPDLATINPGNFVITSVSFIPGYIWKANKDTLDTKNYVNFLSYKEYPENANRFIDNYQKGDYNISYILPTPVRYNRAGIWNKWYIPSFYYMANQPYTYRYEHHHIAYKVSCVSGCGVISTNDIAERNVVMLEDAYPNPAVKSVSIGYELNKPAQVSLEISDILGRKLITFNEGTRSAGNYSIAVDASKLALGIYFYTLKAGETSLTKRMIIAE